MLVPFLRTLRFKRIRWLLNTGIVVCTVLLIYSTFLLRRPPEPRQRRTPEVVLEMRGYRTLPCEQHRVPHRVPPLRVAVVGLVRGHESFDMFASTERRNAFLRSNLPAELVEYDTIIFHEGNLKTEFQHRLRYSYPEIQFRNISEFWQASLARHNAHCGAKPCDPGTPWWLDRVRLLFPILLG
jgi:hypothetical protein